jgi:fructose-1,6-bisphosphatase-3
MQTKIVQMLAEKTHISDTKIADYIQGNFAQIQSLSTEELEIQLAECGVKLNLPLHSVIYVSDPHGNARAFENMFYRRFGLTNVKLQALELDFQGELLQQLLTAGLVEIRETRTKLAKAGEDFLEYVIRVGQLPEQIIPNIEPQALRSFTIAALLQFIKSRALSSNQFNDLWKDLPQHLRANTEAWFRKEIYSEEQDRILSNLETFAEYLRSIAKKARVVTLGQHGKLFILGDIIDRGSEPDNLVELMTKKTFSPYIRYVWGNHDILWMGAAAGNPALVAEALRVSFRYDRTEFLDRMDFDYSRLRDFAKQTYGPKHPGMLVGAKNVDNALMEKALFVIQSKLEHQMIADDKENQYNMQDRLYLKELAAALRQGKSTMPLNGQESPALTDTNFPTLDANNPYALSQKEQAIIADLVWQFQNNENIKKMMDFLFNTGKMYDTHNNNLLIHANVPSNASRELIGVKPFGEDRKGKELFDYLNDYIKGIGQKYLNGEKSEPKELNDILFLWKGQNSPLFDKDKMATWERYLFAKEYEETLGKETSIHWEPNMKEADFQTRLFENFSTSEEKIERVIHGHTPKNPEDLNNVIKYDGKRNAVKINVDVGWIKKYPGHFYFETSKGAYLITCQLSPKELEDIDKDTKITITVKKIVDFGKQRVYKDNIPRSWRTVLYYELLRLEWETRQSGTQSARITQDDVIITG